MIGHTTPPKDFKSTIDIVGIFCEYNGKILYLLKQEHKSQWNKWTDPWGKVSPGEDTQQAILRELFEETGIKLDAVEFVRTYYERYPDMDFTYHKYRAVLQQEPNIFLSIDKHKDYARFTPEEALQHTLILWEDEIIRDIYNIK